MGHTRLAVGDSSSGSGRGVLDGMLWALCEDLLARGELGLEEAFHRLLALFCVSWARQSRRYQQREAAK